MNGYLGPDLSAVVIKDYSVNNILVLMQKMSQRMVDKELLAGAHIQAQVAGIHCSDLGQVCCCGWEASSLPLP